MGLQKISIICVCWGLILGSTCLADPSGNYVLGPGDKMTVSLPTTHSGGLNPNNLTLFGEHAISSYTVEVDSDGAITLPVIGTIMAVGLTLPELISVIEKALTKTSKKPVSVTLLMEYSERKYAYIWGNVKKPGKYHFTTMFTLFDLLTAAEGLTTYGIIDISINRNGTEITANNQTNLLLRFGDVVFVKPLEIKIYLSGEFRSPGTYSIDYESVPLQQAIGLGGGLTEKSDHQITLIHKDGGRSIFDVNKTLESTHNMLEVHRGDTLFASSGWWPNWTEIGAVFLLTRALFKF